LPASGGLHKEGVLFDNSGLAVVDSS